MPSNSVAYGVPQLQIGSPDVANNLTGLTAATVTIVESAPVVKRSSRRQPLPVAALKAWVTLMGYDPLGGYAVTASTATAGSAVTPSAVGKGLLMRIASPLPTSMVDAVCAAIWLQVGSANPQLCDFAIINPKLDFSFTINSLPHPQAPYSTVAKLVGSAADSLLGSTRTPYKQILTVPYETTGGVNLRHRKESFQASPDSSLNYPIVTGRATDVVTRILNPTIDTVADMLDGDYSSYTDTDTASTVVEQMATDIFSTQSSTSGNGAVLVTYAPDSAGRILRRLFLGCVTSNTEDSEENFKKDAQTELALTLTAASLDKLVRGMATGIARIDTQ